MLRIPEIITPPEYWHGGLDTVYADIGEIKLGRVMKMLPSAGGRKIHLIEYGQSGLGKRKANLSSALGAKCPTAYADRSADGYTPTVFLAGCIHGGEFEGTVAIMNLISLLEKGVDLAGRRNDALLSAAQGVHLLLMPMCNPDGRSHIPFDNFVGRSFRDLRYYNQGTWKNGELCGYPDCKAVHPIKDAAGYLGGYFNDDGVNLMHDNFFGHNANETQNILDVCLEYAPDVSVLCHGGDNSVPHFTHSAYCSGEACRQISELARAIAPLYESAGLKGFTNFGNRFETHDPEDGEIPVSFNLVSAMHHCCGTPCITFESNQGLDKENSYVLSNDEIYLSHTLLFEGIFRFVKDARKTRA